MKSILMSIRPQYVAKILNGEKTIEIRKRFPKDYVGWVYIYCTKEKDKNLYMSMFHGNYQVAKNVDHKHRILNGKVVARFWCDKVEPAYKFYVEELCQLACVTEEKLYKYAGGWYKTDDLFAIHITNLEIFDKPKEISEFFTAMGTHKPSYMLQKAPQSWCYVGALK